MADLLIRAEMPRVCANCFACKYDRDSGLSACNISGCVFMFDARLKRDKDCPLVEVPDHGDLIDRAELLRSTPDVVQDDMWVPYVEGYSEEAIMKARPIIPASKEGGE